MVKSKNTILNILIILLIIAFISWIKFKPENNEGVSKELAECISQNSTVYSQIGCTHCEKQKELFGENWKYINEVKCNDDWRVCQDANITGTPTWIINGKLHSGLKSIENLKTITGCEIEQND